MTTLINKSNHPVNIKRINVRIWTLRDEIESCIQKRIEEQGLENVNIDDIKEYYSSLTPKNFPADELDDDNLIEMNAQPGVEDTSEMNEEDIPDDAMNEMAAAMAAEAEENSEDDSASDQDSDKDEDESSESDSDESQQDSENEADDEKAKEMADQIMEDIASEDTSKKSGFQRVKPSKDKMVEGFAFLSEIHMDQILFFGKKNYTKGQNIIIEFLIPKRFSITAEIENCLHIERKSKIISETKPTHRVQGTNIFLFDGERDTLREFLTSVEPVIPPPPKKLKRPDEDEDDEDEFDDLGF
ncbi:MAG: hypothetical protein KC478_13565 [Bacteriovoracaceae bacterium]|nr:hypothetical protein [Bacteriovoracaceae bacterium]